MPEGPRPGQGEPIAAGQQRHDATAAKRPMAQQLFDPSVWIALVTQGNRI
jgi:hypothetical protein